MLRVVVDSAIPFIEGVLEPYFEVDYIAGAKISKSDIQDASALIVRTRTLCDRSLLENTAIKAIFTATIGLDHIDLKYCREAGIKVYSAQGCNARAVAQWVFSAIRELGVDSGFTLGIIGVGNVGGEVLKIAQEQDINIRMCDPRRAKQGDKGFENLEDMLAWCDVVTLHVPLDNSTRGMVNAEFLSMMKKGAALLNSSRGEVVVSDDLLQDSSHIFAFDVWCGEPNVSRELLNRTALATPHIAGYSARGKARGTTFTVQNLAREFGIDALLEWDCSAEYPLEDPFGFDIVSVDRGFRSNPEHFESLRVVRL